MELIRFLFSFFSIEELTDLYIRFKNFEVLDLLTSIHNGKKQEPIDMSVNGFGKFGNFSN